MFNELEVFKKENILIPKSYSILNVPQKCWSKWVALSILFVSLTWGYPPCIPEIIQVNFLIALTFENRNFWGGERNQTACTSVSFLSSCLLISSVCYWGFCLPQALKLSIAQVAFNGFLLLAPVDTFSAYLIFL